ncbi:hypothetical protein ANCCAN_07453 [Ancylostoma caninum]|uniref:C2H2-type domain-containing protein n=1 Tax=Ancylostoma caninum TaxID=29170 RepID=A0A368GTT6_ANCCA|nr:hypothetical protein ANCCAN_07453 [Ancylostoma caninum]
MAAMRDQAIPIAKRKPPTRERGLETTPFPSPALPTDPTSSSAAQPPAPEIEPPRVTNTGYCIGPLQREKCPYCVTRESFNKPVEAIEHIVDHGGSILDVKLSFYDDEKLLATETQLTGEKCNVCDVNFDFPTQYYLHLLLKHRMEVTSFYVPNYPKANNVKFITVMIYRMYPEYTIEFREIMPRPMKLEAQQPQSSGTEAQDTAAEPQAECTKAETESNSKQKEVEDQSESKKTEAQPVSVGDQPESTKAEAQPELDEPAT